MLKAEGNGNLCTNAPELASTSYTSDEVDEPLPFSVTNDVIGLGQCKSFLPLLTRISRTPETQSRGSGVRAPST